ncbi:MAG: hypothetical protein H7145_11915, partial [Akkermansiaceae bacterium]|nr:hypothetical protein [Armatimonadota bacterium]
MVFPFLPWLRLSSAAVLFLLATYLVPRTVQASQQSVMSSAWRAEGGSLRVTPQDGGTFRLETSTGGVGWGNCYIEVAADMEKTPILAVSISGISPGARWSLTVNDPDVHSLLSQSEGVGRLEFDLREKLGRGGKHVFRVYLTVHNAGQYIKVGGISFETPPTPPSAENAVAVDGWDQRTNGATVEATRNGGLTLTNGTTGDNTDNWGGLLTHLTPDHARPFLEVDLRRLSPGARWRVEAGVRASGPEQRNTGPVVLPYEPPGDGGKMTVHLVLLGSSATAEVGTVRLVAAPTASAGLLRRLRQTPSAATTPTGGTTFSTGGFRVSWDERIGALRISSGRSGGESDNSAALLTRLYEADGVDMVPVEIPSAGKKSGSLLLRSRTADGGVLYEARINAFPDAPGLLHWRVTATATREGQRPAPAGHEVGYQPSASGAVLRPLATQNLIATALVQAEAPGVASLFYVQDLTALNPLFERSKASPRFLAACGLRTFGFIAPVSTDMELPVDTPLVVSSAYLYLTPAATLDGNNAEERGVARAFALLKGLATVYEKFPAPPQTDWRDWPALAEKALKEFRRPGVFLAYNGQDYLQSYLGQAGNSPLISAPQDVLAPLLRYKQTLATGASVGEASETLRRVDDSLASFYSPTRKTVRSAALPGDHVWYDPAHHANLARAALLGDAAARDVCLRSVDALIALARLTGYTFRGEGLFTDENQAAGPYLLFLTQCYEMTDEARFLEEAKRAADHLVVWTPAATRETFWTAMTCEGLARLYEATKDRRYLRLSFLPLADLMRNVWLWECDFGHAGAYTTFWGMNADASGLDYTAPMEQHQSWCSLREYYQRTRADLPPPARLLVSEFLRCVPETIWFTYPAHLPPASLYPMDRKTFWQTTNAYDAYIPVEDLNDGWRKNGYVGQELYGAGAAFQIASLTCTPVPQAGILVYCEYPLLETPRWDARKGELVLRVGGVGSHSAKLEISSLPGSDGPKGWFVAGAKTPGGVVSPPTPGVNKP